MNQDFRINFTLPAQPLGEAIRAKKDREAREHAGDYGLPSEQGREDGADLIWFRCFKHEINGAARGDDQSSQVPEGNRTKSPEAAPPSAPVFKVGDRVRAVDGLSYSELMRHGVEGVVVEAGLGVMVEMDRSGCIQFFPPRMLELLPTDDGWIEWKGGECPVAPTALVQVRYNDWHGHEPTYPANKVCWKHIFTNANIVAYRILKEQPEG